jgi:hypothetical protein
MSWAFGQPLSGNEKVVLLAIADFANDDGLCWPSIPSIAKKACVSVRTVQRIISELLEQNYLSVDRRLSADGRSTSNCYNLVFGGDKLSPMGDTVDTGTVTLLSPHNEPSIEPSLKKNNKGGRVSDDFAPNGASHSLALKLGIDITTDVIEGFLDYWRGVPGAKGVKLDWQATFRNQLRHISKQKASKPNGTRHGNQSSKKIHPVDVAVAKLRTELGLDESGGNAGCGEPGWIETSFNVEGN